MIYNKLNVLAIFFLIGATIFLSACTQLEVKDDELQESDVKLYTVGEPSETASKLYWFIPDGMRTDPDLFNIFKWAEEGKLPNIKRMMNQGSYGYSIPQFPSHTPVNFAT